MWVISAVDASMGIDLTGIDKLVYYKTDPEGKTVVDQNGQPILDHYELVGHGFGNFAILLLASVSENEVNDASKAIFYEMSKGTEMFDLMDFITQKRQQAVKKDA